MTAPPNSVTLGPVRYSVGVGDVVDAGGYFSAGHAPNIVIANDVDPPLRPRVLCHEIGHAFCYQTGLFRNDLDGEERFCDACATMLLSLFRDNPQLVKWLQET